MSNAEIALYALAYPIGSAAVGFLVGMFVEFIGDAFEQRSATSAGIAAAKPLKSHE